MNDALEVEAAYKEALRIHLTTDGQESLVAPYELGRRAIDEGVGIILLASVHHQVLARALAEVTDATKRAEIVDRAGLFFMEAISPHEKAARGYKDANDAMKAANAALTKANQQTETANSELEAFSYSVAHDLRAPLRSIDGFSQMLLDEPAIPLGSQARSYLDRVRKAAQRMGVLIDDLLRLSRISRAELKPGPVDLSELARAAAEDLVRVDPKRSVELINQKGVTAQGDARLLRLVFDNLLGNAFKFTGKTEHPRVEFGTTTRDEQVVYFVRDNGAGFDMAHATKLFAPFQRLHADSDFVGTGIGLATSQRIISRHGGRIWAEAEVGRGATFLWTLPPGG